MDKFDQQSSTELGRATYREGPLGATGPRAGRRGLCMACEWLFKASLSDAYHRGLVGEEKWIISSISNPDVLKI